MRSYINSILLLSVIILLLTTSCEKLPSVYEPIDDLGLIPNTNPVLDAAKPLIEGIYSVVAGKSEFGDFVVVKSVNNHYSIFCQKNAAYFILSSGTSDSTFYFEGYWRFSQTKNSGKAKLQMSKAEGGRELTALAPFTVPPVIRGYYGESSSEPTSSIILKYAGPLQQDSNFSILAHRGGGRNSDRLPASENSLEILQLAEYFGANGVEIDIQLTKDNVPILFHDEDFTSRLVKGNYLIGKVSNFSFKQIRTFGRLIHDEKIPTLQEALDVILYNTTIQTVWLDVKYPSALATIAPVQKQYKELAKSAGRDLTILLGLPTEDVLNKYLEYPGREQYATLCELDIASVRKANAQVWAPRWTDGIQPQQIYTMHAENRKVFVWTLDLPEVISDYISTGNYDGILTNYPSVVAYNYYTRSK